MDMSLIVHGFFRLRPRNIPSTHFWGGYMMLKSASFRSSETQTLKGCTLDLGQYHFFHKIDQGKIFHPAILARKRQHPNLGVERIFATW